MAKITKADWHDIHNPKPGEVARLRKATGPTLLTEFKRAQRAHWRAVTRHHKIYARLVAKLGEKSALTLMKSLEDEVRRP